MSASRRTIPWTGDRRLLTHVSKRTQVLLDRAEASIPTEASPGRARGGLLLPEMIDPPLHLFVGPTRVLLPGQGQVSPRSKSPGGSFDPVHPIEPSGGRPTPLLVEDPSTSSVPSMAPRFTGPTAEPPWEPRIRSTREGQILEISTPTGSGRDTSEIIESIADEILYRIQRERTIMEERGGLE